MSHVATKWAFDVRGLKPGPWKVLMHLADRHNKDFGCFPSQELLAEDTEIPRSTLNVYLNELEEKGLLRRELCKNERSQRFDFTRYIFAFEADFPCPETGHGSESRNAPEPSPENGESRVQKLDTNPVREPVKEPAGAQAREDGFEELWNGWPEASRPPSKESARAVFFRMAPADRPLAVRNAFRFRSMKRIRDAGKALMLPYLKGTVFRELEDGPAIDVNGYFVITPERPEWPVWVEHWRATDRKALEYFGQLGRALLLFRWPPADTQPRKGTRPHATRTT